MDIARRLLVVMFIAAALSCTTRTADEEGTRETIRKLDMQLTQAANLRALDRFMNFLAVDTSLTIVFDGNMSIGWQAFRRGQQSYWATLSRAAYVPQETRITVLDANTVLVVKSGTATATPIHGPPQSGGFVQTMLWQRRPEGWRVVHAHESTRPDSTR